MITGTPRSPPNRPGPSISTKGTVACRRSRQICSMAVAGSANTVVPVVVQVSDKVTMAHLAP
jgi:hypothetical protein